MSMPRLIACPQCGSPPTIGPDALKARNRFLEEMGAECAQDWQKIERLLAEIQRANEYALRLVLSLASRFPATEGFRALPDLDGRLTQIDNMTCRLPLGFGNSGGGES